MSNKHEGCIRGFHQYSKSWYNKDKEDKVIEEISFGMMHPDGGTTGEMYMRWYLIDENLPPAAKLESFQDSWDALSTFGDLIQKMAEFDREHPQPEDFVKLLEECGFKDLTETETPLRWKVNFGIYGSWSPVCELPTYEDVVNSEEFNVIQKIIESDMFVVVTKEECLKIKSIHVDRDAAMSAQSKIPGISGVLCKRGF
jgi:hypothetical protein